jgi:hypothetical protein
LEDFLEISRRRRSSRTAISKLQISLLQEIVSHEALVKRYKQHLDEIKDPDSDEAHATNREIFMHRVYSNAIRTIGDGIAWRALNYDRAFTRLMAEHANKQQVMSEGLMGELVEWSIQFDRGLGIAILNSLTNCLTIGDVTVVNDDGSAEVIEVKSSNTKSRRKIRQKSKMREIVTLLSEGKGAADDKQVSIEILPINPESGLDKIAGLLSEADRVGWAASKISNCLYVECFDFEKMPSFSTIENDVEKARKNATLDWIERQDFVVDFNSLDLIAFSPNRAPFSVFPFSTRTCVELMIGKKCYIGYLNENAVAREFAFRGWDIVKSTEQLIAERKSDLSIEQSLIVRKERLTISIPPADFMRMHMEALRAQTLIQACEAQFEQGPRGTPGHVLQIYEGEPLLWN